MANILFTRALAKRLLATGVTANSLHPGIIRPKLVRRVLLTEICLSPLSMFLKTVKSGAQTTIALAVDPELQQVSGKFFADCRISNESDRAQDDEMVEWLWETSEIMTGLKEPV